MLKHDGSVAGNGGLHTHNDGFMTEMMESFSVRCRFIRPAVHRPSAFRSDRLRRAPRAGEGGGNRRRDAPAEQG